MSGPMYDPMQNPQLQSIPQTGQFVPPQQLAMLKALQEIQKRKQLADLLRNSGVTVPPPDQGQMP